MYWVWANYFAYDNYDALLDFQKEYVAAMTADTYGGKTPQETLDLFVKALRAGDIDLAAKYFALDDKLSREKWIVVLNSLKTSNLLSQMANDISSKSQPDIKNITGEDDYKFVLYDSNGKVGARINMQFNKYSGVWKIESL